MPHSLKLAILCRCTKTSILLDINLKIALITVLIRVPVGSVSTSDRHQKKKKKIQMWHVFMYVWKIHILYANYSEMKNVDFSCFFSLLRGELFESVFIRFNFLQLILHLLKGEPSKFIAPAPVPSTIAPQLSTTEHAENHTKCLYTRP